MIDWVLRKLGYRLIEITRLEELLATEIHYKDLRGIDPERIGRDEPWDSKRYIEAVRAQKRARTRYIDLNPACDHEEEGMENCVGPAFGNETTRHYHFTVRITNNPDGIESSYYRVIASSEEEARTTLDKMVMVDFGSCDYEVMDVAEGGA